MSSRTTSTSTTILHQIQQLKNALSKELAVMRSPKDGPSSSSTADSSIDTHVDTHPTIQTNNTIHVDRCLDILSQLDSYEMNLDILTQTLIGTVVSKLKHHPQEEISNKAKQMIQKWKQVAHHTAEHETEKMGRTQKKTVETTTRTMKTTTTTTTTTRNQRDESTFPKKHESASDTTRVTLPTQKNGSTSQNNVDFISHLPHHRKNIVLKLQDLFVATTVPTTSTTTNHNTTNTTTTAAGSEKQEECTNDELAITRAIQVEEAMHRFSRNDKNVYTEKARSILFNMKKNETLREHILLGSIPAEELVSLRPDQLATAEKVKERSSLIQHLSESRRLDWEQANENKINEICGIKGDLLKASLFQCARCKSEKTTSTQKQTRSADEPMTVFVLCLNCGKRWKC